MADALKPIFEYEDLKGKIETEVTTCVNGKCTTKYEETPYNMTMLKSVVAWNQTITSTATPFTTEWESFTTTFEEIIKTPKPKPKPKKEPPPGPPPKPKPKPKPNPPPRPPLQPFPVPIAHEGEKIQSVVQASAVFLFLNNSNTSSWYGVA